MHRITNWDNQISNFWCWCCIWFSFPSNTFQHSIFPSIKSQLQPEWEKSDKKLQLYYIYFIFYCVSILFLSFLFHFILKRYVFIFACTVIFWLEQDGVYRIVRPIYTRFSWHKKLLFVETFLYKIIYAT